MRQNMFINTQSLRYFLKQLNDFPNMIRHMTPNGGPFDRLTPPSLSEVEGNIKGNNHCENGLTVYVYWRYDSLWAAWWCSG